MAEKSSRERIQSQKIGRVVRRISNRDGADPTGTGTSRQYDWNVHVVVEGVSFDGPGMETRHEAEAIKGIVESNDAVQKAEVFKQ